jgi:hypothetical protein
VLCDTNSSPQSTQLQQGTLPGCKPTSFYCTFQMYSEGLISQSDGLSQPLMLLIWQKPPGLTGPVSRMAVTAAVMSIHPSIWMDIFIHALCSHAETYSGHTMA